MRAMVRYRLVCYISSHDESIFYKPNAEGPREGIDEHDYGRDWDRELSPHKMVRGSEGSSF